MANFEIGDAAHLQQAHDTLNTLFAEKKFGTPIGAAPGSGSPV